MIRAIHLCIVAIFCYLLSVTEAGIVSCPCSDSSLCQLISGNPDKEIFIFSLSDKPTAWKNYDWKKVTTVVMVGYVSHDLMCYAHRYGARAVLIGNFPTSNLTNIDARRMWVKEQLQKTQSNFLDGINIDYEDAIPKDDINVRDGYTQLVSETYETFKNANKNYQVTVDVAWSPSGIDKRFYDYIALSAVTDFLFVMSYDEQSQIHGDCVAGANSGYYKTFKGLEDYLTLPVPRSKLVLGIPWYGYVYPCIMISEDGRTCKIRQVPFRGVNCSDAAGKEYNFSFIKQTLLNHSTTGRRWDTDTMSPYFDFNYDNITYQVWYDDPESLSLKYKLAVMSKLRGVGMWNADAVDPIQDQEGTKMMWDALPDYKSKEIYLN
ncbi:hypothetical protein FSP39_023057 [Pinctada imbricata]|uniref:Di-N-acetylchitobiase n=1 Tax=Pinctada imbricata TaxID=66713 RepID=A0AA88XU28_PINIB|nr:hypothetical protein FSP39_023057 [Pinctada imbricata]